MHLHFCQLLTNKMDNLTENAKVLILSKLEKGWSIRMVAQHYNIAKSTVQRIKQTILWCSKISATFYVVKNYLTYTDRHKKRLIIISLINDLEIIFVLIFLYYS
jgi:hypothetical protein